MVYIRPGGSHLPIFMKEKEPPKELLVKKFLGKVNPTGWRTNRKAALAELENIIFSDKAQVCTSHHSTACSSFDRPFSDTLKTIQSVM
jgi:hypothetical protein